MNAGLVEAAHARADGAARDLHAADVLRVGDVDAVALAQLLAWFGLSLAIVDDAATIPGSYWGEPEAGVIADAVHVRADTPVHSALHEACHLIVAGPERRAGIHTDASDCDDEENATCYLQIVLADALPGVGRDRLMTDMDRWGYSFRLGSARTWFECDADDARDWLLQRGLIEILSDGYVIARAIGDAPNLAAKGGRV